MLYISEYLSDKDKIIWASISIAMTRLKNKFAYHERIFIEKITSLQYFDNFECVSVCETTYICPKNAKRVYFVAYTTDIPSFVTHLTFSDFNEPIKNIIPESVTHLTFEYKFDQSIENSIPESVTHLIFGGAFNHPIKCCIPKSVIYLEFGSFFNQSIDNSIPASVTHLRFGFLFNQPLNDIPSTIEEIVIYDDYNHKIDSKLKTKIKILDFNDEIINYDEYPSHIHSLFDK